MDVVRRQGEKVVREEEKLRKAQEKSVGAHVKCKSPCECGGTGYWAAHQVEGLRCISYQGTLSSTSIEASFEADGILQP